MWYFAWILGTGFAACFAIINAIWCENKIIEKERMLRDQDLSK